MSSAPPGTYILDGTFLFPVVLILAYLITCVLSLVSYGVYYHKQTALYGSTIPNAFIAFAVIGTVFFVVISSILWMRAAKYAVERRYRYRGVCQGIWVMFFFKDLPLFSIECSAVVTKGWRNGYQSFNFVVQIIFFILSLMATWLTLAWFFSGLLDRYFAKGDLPQIVPRPYAKACQRKDDEALRMYLKSNPTNEQPLLLHDAAAQSVSMNPHPAHDDIYHKFPSGKQDANGSYFNDDIQPTPVEEQQTPPFSHSPPLPLQSIEPRAPISSPNGKVRSTSSGREFRWD